MTVTTYIRKQSKPKYCIVQRHVWLSVCYSANRRLSTFMRVQRTLAMVSVAAATATM